MNEFLPRNIMLARYMCLSICPSICPTQARVIAYIKVAKRMIIEQPRTFLILGNNWLKSRFKI